MRQKILKVVIAISLITTLTFANFLLLGVNAISYAAEAINVNKATNHKNVEFMAYFKDGEEKNLIEIDANTNVDSLPLYFKVAVKQEGYFNGKIILNDANFKLKTDILSDAVNKIEDNIIYLNQINAGEEKEIQVNVELKKEERIDISSINAESSISIEGTYRNQQEKDIDINSNRNVTLNFVNPENASILTQEVITNKILSYNGQEKRIIQIEVKSGLKDNTFPLKKANIKLQTPKISDKYPEEVFVNSNMNLVTNGNKLAKDNWNYDETTGLVNIEIENKQDNNTISWLKNGQDEFIITYIFDKDVQIDNQVFEAFSNIELYDTKNTQIEAENKIILDSEEKDSIIRLDIMQNEASIYKGKLNTEYGRDITYTNTIELNLVGTTEKISILEKQLTIDNRNISSVYKTTKLRKENIQNILGDEGILTIKNADTDSVIASITKDSEADEYGNIIITYPENVYSIKIEITSPQKVGNIQVETTRTINKNLKNVIKENNKIDMVFKSSYTLNDIQNKYEDVLSTIELKDTETYASLEMNRTELSAMTSNNNVEFRIVLHSRDEKNELYKNPVVRIELPEKIQEIQVNSVNLIDEEELKIKKATLNGNIIEIVFEGEQTKYKDEAIEGATLIINANLIANKKIASCTEQVKLTYTNENATRYANGNKNGEIIQDINIVSHVGVVATNQIADYGIEVVNNEGNKGAKLAVSSNSKKVDINKNIINNSENKITDVRILGLFPTHQSVENNNIDVEVGELSISGIDKNRVKIYYSENANATDNLQDVNNGWKETIENNKLVKKYLIVIDELQALEEIGVKYSITIPSNLEYNETAEEGYTVYYKDNNRLADKQVKLDNIELTTGIGASVETTLKAYVAGEENETVKEASFIRYEMKITNTGTEDATNVKVIGQVPDGATYVKIGKVDYGSNNYNAVIEDKDKKQVEVEIPLLKKGETFTGHYQVKVNENTEGKKLVNSVVTEYGEVSKKSNEVTTTVIPSNLKMTLSPVDDTGVIKAGYAYRYILLVKNISEEKLSDVKVELNKNLDVTTNIIPDVGVEVENNVATIKSMEPGEEKTIVLSITPKEFFTQDKKDTILLGKATIGEDDTFSNEVIRTIEGYNIELNVTSDNSGDYVKAGDTIKYKINVKNSGSTIINNLSILNEISSYTTLESIEKDGKKLSEGDYSLKQRKIEINTSLNPGESQEYVINVIVNVIPNNDEAIKITNLTSFRISGNEVKKEIIEHIMEPEAEKPDNGGGDNGNNNGDNNGDNGGQTDPDDDKNSKIITGVAWLDANEDGKRDPDETKLSGVTVKLFDAKNNKLAQNSDGKEITSVTDKEGFYSLSGITEGEYVVIFEYDMEKYILTTYQKEGVSEQYNSNAILRTLTIDGKEITIGSTDLIKITNSNVGNIDLGLQEAKTFDLKLDKFVNKVTVQNSKGTDVTEYTNSKLAKKEIDAKLINGTTVVVEYVIKVTNEGDVPGYARKIVDYLPSEFEFSSDLNTDWYRLKNDIYTTSLSNEKIQPGESKEVKLILTKKMNENSTGLIPNVAEIVDSYNELGLKDIDSTVNNHAKDEDDMSTAELILSIKTGEIVATIGITFLIVALAAVGIFAIVKIILRKRML